MPPRCPDLSCDSSAAASPVPPPSSSSSSTYKRVDTVDEGDESECCSASTAIKAPKCSSLPFLEAIVKAPATLQEGFVFWASHGEYSFPVTVPRGGVRSGQRMHIALKEEDCVPQKGQWKDGLFSCLRVGVFHPSHWNAWMCPQILLGQLLTRMKLTWLVTAASKKSSLKSTFRAIMAFMILFSAYDAFVAPPLLQFDVNEQGEIIFLRNEQTFPPWHQILYICMSLPLSFYGIYVVAKLRESIRAKYGIPTGRLGRLEDACCVCFCNCCVMAQMARQTANYKEQSASCCSSNGLKGSASTGSLDSDDSTTHPDV